MSRAEKKPKPEKVQCSGVCRGRYFNYCKRVGVPNMKNVCGRPPIFMCPDHERQASNIWVKTYK